MDPLLPCGYLRMDCGCEPNWFCQAAEYERRKAEEKAKEKAEGVALAKRVDGLTKWLDALQGKVGRVAFILISEYVDSGGWERVIDNAMLDLLS